MCSPGSWRRSKCCWGWVPLHPDCRTLAEYLPAEFRRSYLGKWHLGDEIFPQHGWHDWISIEDLYEEHYSPERDLSARSDYHHYLQRNGFPCDRKLDSGPVFSRGYSAVMAEPHTKAGWLGRQAADLIRSHADDGRPWVMSVNFLEPHMPFYGPFNHHHDPETLQVPPIFNRLPDGPLPASYQTHCHAHDRHGYDGQDVTTEAGWRRLMANYYGLVEMVDNAIGNILSTLEASGQGDNTIVVFTSDHGEMMGSHHMLGKGVFYQQSIRVPLIVRLPGQTQSRRLSGPFSHIDLLPTLLDLLGQPLPEGLSGHSRADALHGGVLPTTDVFLFWHPQKPGQPRALKGQAWRGIVTPDGWKYAWSPDEDTGLLFDLNRDPWEECNLYHDPHEASRRHELHKRLRAWMEHEQDPLAVFP
jgi:arylsulfatase A-like enzyme